MTVAREQADIRPGIDKLMDRLGLGGPPDEDYTILIQAFVHRSWSVEHEGARDNERLEFLGDAIIGLLTTEYLFETLPEASEGELSKLRAAMVSRKILGNVARELEIGPLLLLGLGEEANGGRERLSILGSALEAFCGALGQMTRWDRLREALRPHIVEPALRMARERVIVDYKSRLQEWTQRHLGMTPGYRVAESTGPDHDRVFRVELSIGPIVWSEGAGGRIKWAENEAARRALDRIRHGDVPEPQEGG